MAFLSITLCTALLVFSIWFLLRAISLNDCAKRSVDAANAVIESTPLYYKGIKSCYSMRFTDHIAVVCEYETSTQGRNYLATIKQFYYNAEDESDYYFAVMQAEELIEKLTD